MTDIENTRATIYENKIQEKNDSRRYFIDWIKNSNKTSIKVLDVGCACGNLGYTLKSEFPNCSLFAFEYNKESIKIAESKNCYSKIFQTDLNYLDINALEEFYEYFDFIVMGDIIEHLYNHEILIEKLKKLIKPQGIFLISIPNIAHGSIQADILKNNFNYTPTGILDKTHIRFFTYKTTASFLAKAGLKIIDYKYTFNIKGTQGYNSFKKLPIFIKLYIHKNKYSYILQYVLKCEISSEKNLEEKNLKYITSNTPPQINNSRIYI